MRTLTGFILALMLITGCATYTTPGAGVNVGNLAAADQDIAEIMSREPAAAFPARIALARVQASGYSSKSNSCYGKGQYCMVTARDVEDESDFAALAALPMVADVAPLNRILVPENLGSMHDLRVAAAQLKTDMLLVYTFDTRFNVDSTDIGPLQLVSLGYFRNKKAHVTTTASAALLDVRTGFTYGVAESTASAEQSASFWSSADAIDKARTETEAESFRNLMQEVQKLWKSVVETHAVAAAP
jgi:hypothetical protein